MTGSDSRGSGTASPFLDGTALFLASAALLLTEGALARVLSALYRHDASHLLLETALLGIGVAGTCLSRWAPADIAGWRRAASRFASAGAILLVLAVFGMGRLPLMTLLPLAAAMGLFAVLAVAPASVLALEPDRFGTLYAADLAGAAAGAGLSYGLLAAAGAPAALGFAALLSGLAAAILAREPAVRHLEVRARSGLSIVVPGGVLAALLVWGGPSMPSRDVWSPSWWRQDRIELTRWFELGRVDVTEPYSCIPIHGGETSPLHAGRRYVQRLVSHDGLAFTSLYRAGADASELELVHHLSVGLPFAVLERPEVLILGAGGGIDALVALANGARRVDAVELSRVTVELVKMRYASFVGAAARDPRVTWRVSEGRRFVESSASPYDLVMVSSVSPLKGGRFDGVGLSPSTLDTVEGARSMLERLRGGGLLAMSLRTTEGLRWCAAARRALEDLGVEPGSARRHFFGVWAENRSLESRMTLLTSRAPLTENQLERLRRFASERAFEIAFDPESSGGARQELRRRLGMLLQPDPERLAKWISRSAEELRPATDDWPFFLQQYRPFLGGPLPAGLHLLALSGAVAIATGLVVVIWPVRKGAVPLGWRSGLAAAIYFGALGAGFLSTELPLVRFATLVLGSPAAGLAAVLAALLAGAGAGSAMTQCVSPGCLRAWVRGMPLLPLGLAGVAAASKGWLLAAPAVPAWTVVLCLSGVAGFALGGPMPAGIRSIAARGPATVAWAWALAAFGTVAGTAIAQGAALLGGYRASFVLAAAFYAAAALAEPFMAPRDAPSRDAR